jgi:opacity protein-like surface antigen
MKRMCVVWGIGAAVLATSPAWAQAEEAPPSEAESGRTAEPAPEAAPPQRVGLATAGAFQLGAGFRYGADLNDGDFNPWGVGLGLSAGYTLPVGVYLGGNFEYFFGDSIEAGGIKIKGNVWQLSAEGGYDVGLGDNFVIRPKIGVGIAGLKSSVEGCPAGFTCAGSNSETKPLIAPGATFMLFTRHVSLAFDVRYAVIFADTTGKALIFSAGIGF